MTSTLTYRPEPPPSPETAELIKQEARNLSRIAEHWSEPYCFLRTAAHPFIGHTKVSVVAYTDGNKKLVQVEPAEDAFMMAQEIEKLLRGISGWARCYQQVWHIGFD